MQHLRKKKYSFNIEKNAKLLKERKIGFERVIDALVNGRAFDIKKHPNQKDYPNQELIYVLIDEKVFVVPCVKESEDSIFIKTIFRCDKIQKQYFPDSEKEK